jgi:outer membrane protein insertion porin family
MMNRIQQLIVLSILIVLIVSVSLSTYALDIKEISVRGNTLIPDSTILSQLDSKVGLPYNPEIVTQDIQKIYNIGFFSSIQVYVEDVAGGAHLTFILEERPLINSIAFKGNKKLKEERLKEVLTLSPSAVSDPLKLKFYPLKIKEDIENLKQLYHKEGFHDVRITSALIPHPSDPQKKIMLQYIIEENKKVQIRGVHFKGNAAFSEKQLRKTMITRTKGFFSFITGSGKYEEETFETDRERLKFFYVDHGYIDMRVTDYVLDFRDNTGNLYITITVEEGDIYTISKVGITGNTVYSTEDIQKVINVSPNDPFSRSKILKDRMAISDLYAQKGYLTPISENTEGKLLIDPRIHIDREQKLVDLTYSIREGEPHFLNRIVITGNQLTRDKVIRRELKLQEGDLFNSKLMERSRQNIVNLALFDEVKFNLAEGSKARTVDLDIDVTERSSIGSFNFGGGWSSLDHWTISGGVTASNLFGLAHEIDFSATIGGTSQLFNLSYTIPRFLDSQYSVGIDAYNTKREYTSYDFRSTGGGLRLGRKISDHLFGTIKYRYEQDNIRNVDVNASTRIKEAEGLSTTSGAGVVLRFSTINNVLLPTKGLLTKLSGEVAGGILQGDNNFYKIINDNNLYIPLVKDVALRLRGEYAYVKEYGESDKVPIFERFFGGGIDVIRGYEERSIGPKDENDEPIGGNTRIVLTSEVIVPIRKEIRLLTFFDMGDVYGPGEDIDVSTFKKSVGVGARLYTPFGLIRLDWGYKLKKEPGESDYAFHFGIGAPF